MRIAPFLVTALVLACAVSAQEPKANPRLSPSAEQFKQRMELERRAYALRPRRRDEPLRYLNISDNEVREIEHVAEKHLARTMLNISPVVEGCPCEEGPLCTEQVYVVTYASEKPLGLQISRVKNVWLVGVVQQWWLEYDALRAREKKMDLLAFRRAESELFRDFPSCVEGSAAAPAANIAATPKVEAKK